MDWTDVLKNFCGINRNLFVLSLRNSIWISVNYDDLCVKFKNEFIPFQIVR